MSTPTNRYCERLGIPVPRVEDVMGRRDVTLSHLAVVALLEHGGPMSIAEIAARLSRAGLPSRLAKPDMPAALRRAWHGQPPMVRDGPDRLALDLLSRDLEFIEFVTGIHPDSWGPESGRPAPSASVRAEARAWRQAADVERARAARRALLHAVPPGQPPSAAAVIDLRSGKTDLYLGDDLGRLPARLDDFDFLAGVDLRVALRALGTDPERWLLAELRPVQRTFRPSRGAALPVTLQAAVKATTGVSRVPADAATWERLVDPKRLHRVGERLVHEAAVLRQFFEYGAGHGGVRLRARPDDALLPVDWAMRGDPDIHATLDAAARALAPVEVVIGAPAGAADPWGRAVRADILDRLGVDVVLRVNDEVRALTMHDLWGVRIPDLALACRVRPRSAVRSFRGVCRLTVTLDGIEPPIWRRLTVPSWYSLDRVHEVLQIALGWTNSHLYVFTIGDERLGTPYELLDLEEIYTRSSRLLSLDDVIALGHHHFRYEYDFGDGWEHTVVIEPLPEADDPPGLACVEGARSVPPEDCGGIGGYEALLEVLFDPTHEEFERSREWVGPAFDPERCSLREINWRLGEWQRTGQMG